jgi:hypothetical protein
MLAKGSQKVSIASGTERTESGNSHFSAEVQAAIRAELEMMLATPIFAQSNRCKNFLNFVVVQTLTGNASQLKERTIGINVFERSNDYDTGEDSIVRVTANEVRKRLGQFYRESQATHSIQIELPRGAYVPEFKIHPDRRRARAEEIVAPKPLEQVAVIDKISPPEEIHPTSTISPNHVSRNQTHLIEIDPPRRPDSRKLLMVVAFVVLLIGITAAVYQMWRIRAHHEIPQLWDAFINAKVPVLVCIDAHDLHTSEAVAPQEADKFSNEILHKQIISVDDAAVLGTMAGLLGRKGVSFRVAGAEQTSLADIRRQPVILIGAVGNKWTIALSKDLPYRIEVANPLGPYEPPIASIVGAGQPAGSPWRIDFSIPLSAWKNDYAIVAKIDDATTGVPVMIEAGLGNDGSLTASELIASDNLTTELKDAPQCSRKSNFEVVIETDIIGREPGPPHILRLKCW